LKPLTLLQTLVGINKFIYLVAVNGHTAVVYKNFMYLYGGKISPVLNTPDVYKFDLNKFSWELLENIKGLVLNVKYI
jgi:hypothetical protein